QADRVRADHGLRRGHDQLRALPPRAGERRLEPVARPARDPRDSARVEAAVRARQVEARAVRDLLAPARAREPRRLLRELAARLVEPPDGDPQYAADGRPRDDLLDRL